MTKDFLKDLLDDISRLDSLSTDGDDVIGLTAMLQEGIPSKRLLSGLTGTVEKVNESTQEIYVRFPVQGGPRREWVSKSSCKFYDHRD